MIDNDQLTDLAREYAEEIYPHEEGEDLGQMEFLRTSATKHIESSLKMLTRRYCLVEKKDVEAKYQEAKERYFNPDDEIEKTMYGGRMSMLEYLFPEITKEVEG